jgi:hypothetical protein
VRALLLGPATPGITQDAIAEGLRAFGYRVAFGRQTLATLDDVDTIDLLLTWGERHPQTAPLLSYRRAHGLRSIVYDLPLLRFAGHGEEWVGLYPGQVGHPWDVPVSEARLKQMGVPCPEPVRKGTGVLLLAQVPGDGQHLLDLTAYGAWMAEAVSGVDAPVTIRPHPMARTIPIPVGCDVADPAEPLSEQLQRFAGAICYNSSAQFVCYATGTPVAVWVRGERWPAVASHADARARLAQAAWNDWTIPELRDPETWEVVHSAPPAPTTPVEVAAPRKPKKAKVRA